MSTPTATPIHTSHTSPVYNRTCPPHLSSHTVTYFPSSYTLIPRFTTIPHYIPLPYRLTYLNTSSGLPVYSLIKNSSPLSFTHTHESFSRFSPHCSNIYVFITSYLHPVPLHFRFSLISFLLTFSSPFFHPPIYYSSHIREPCLKTTPHFITPHLTLPYLFHSYTCASPANTNPPSLS